ncbi:hypothetical protein [Chryseolinea lacunae]|uniref:Uncharacterized protein n=1 Tax=Chryseolinea lacunae TaxID=2801331 RepID=A0ABS1KTR5_9BACT|nr:hypothetical protein [Chryseolinea lacunae]MBL0742774.1 hypothetical protein [Chryseolinea lacunae]
MSQAFVREGDEQSLSDISPTLTALVNLLTRENGGIKVYEKRTETDAAGKTLHVMSNGLTYFKNDQGKWDVKL